MKKVLFGILTFLGIGLSFCSAVSINCPSPVTLSSSNPCYSWQPSIDCYYLDLDYEGGIEADSYQVFVKYNSNGSLYSLEVSDPLGYSTPRGRNINLTNSDGVSSGYFCFVDSLIYNSLTNDDYKAYYFLPKESGGSSSSDITVYYNSGSSTTIECDGTQAIEIQGLSTITSTNTFTPYFNIDYIDENNQLLTESYSKDVLYLSGTTFKKTYTGNNERILTSQGTPESIFTGYTPVFDVTGQVSLDTGNVFNNFADNSLKVLLSNIPAYIQYITIGFILLFLFGFIRRFKKKR